ncbi:MAG: hypothetical protein KGI19_09940 [Thaumarchaeota archaeon]|nr:hypothetical protein [Nitrososphaerota archaeon]
MIEKGKLYYFLRSGSQFFDFYKEYLAQDGKNILFILGLGFDPRTTNCLKTLLDIKPKSNLDCMVFNYSDDFNGREPMQTWLKQNESTLNHLIPKSKWKTKQIQMMSGKEHIASIEASKKIEKDDLSGYTDIILDISAMPSSVYFPIVRKILDWIKSDELKLENGKKINFHMVLSENAHLDSLIKEVGINETVTYMHKFVGTLQSEAKQILRKVWIPLLGEKKGTQLEKINEEISPKEVSPIFPMPSKDPYRSKRLLLEHRSFLFDTLVMDARDFIYANEQNPFEVYRQIYQTAVGYYDSFDPLGGCHVVISPLSSKLMCVGALLAAYELQSDGMNVGIVHVENQTYDMENIKDVDQETKKSVQFTMWLAGDCYAD